MCLRPVGGAKPFQEKVTELLTKIVMRLLLRLSLESMTNTLEQFDAVLDGAVVISIGGSCVDRELSTGKKNPSIAGIETQFDASITQKGVPPRDFQECTG